MNKELNSIGINKKSEDTTVVVAMSGGVDSSVTATLLVKAGFNVVGLTMQLYDHGKSLKKRSINVSLHDTYSRAS